jgi:hypothetical protein
MTHKTGMRYNNFPDMNRALKALEAERDRLREALKQITDMRVTSYDMAMIAREALEVKDD